MTLACPDCGAPLDLTDGLVGRMWFSPTLVYPHTEIRLQAGQVAACTGCEFCLELTDTASNRRIA